MRRTFLLTAGAALALLAAVQTSGAAAQQPGNQTAATACAACHGPTGNSTDPRIPKLAGQNPAYLAEQLWAFKTGSRPSASMDKLAAGLTPAGIDALARFYSGQAVQPDAVKDRALADRGRRLFFQGTRWPAATPPCAECHSSRGGFGPPGMGGMMGGGMMGGGMGGGGAGRMGPVPTLNGQHAAYLLEQLQGYATGQRPSFVMNRIAAGLTWDDGRALATYLSGKR